MDKGRLYQVCGDLIEWVYDHVGNDAEFERVLTDKIGLSLSEVYELGFGFDNEDEDYVDDDREYIDDEFDEEGE